jgi:hypothetical protein
MRRSQPMNELELIKQQEHERDLQRLRGLRPIDDDFMRGMFKGNLPLAQFVLRIITGKSDLVLTKCETQADLKRVTGARSICLDAYGTDASGKKYDLEIQRADKGADPHRARYHSSVMDVENLDVGQEFKELPDTYTIFITEKDFFDKGLPVYLIHKMNFSTGEPFDDGAYIIYVNGEYRGEDELGRLMHDFNCCDAADMNYNIMAERTRYLKENQKGVNEMCKAMEEMRNETAIETARRTVVGDILKMMKNLKLSAEEAMAALEITTEDQSVIKTMLPKA